MSQERIKRKKRRKKKSLWLPARKAVIPAGELILDSGNGVRIGGLVCSYTGFRTVLDTGSQYSALHIASCWERVIRELFSDCDNEKQKDL